MRVPHRLIDRWAGVQRVPERSVQRGVGGALYVFEHIVYITTKTCFSASLESVKVYEKHARTQWYLHRAGEAVVQKGIAARKTFRSRFLAW